MGRGVRSNEDYCSIVLMRKDLINIIYNSNGDKYFSPATQKQFELSLAMYDQLYNQSLDDIIETLDLCLEQNERWVSIGKSHLNKVDYDSKLSFSNDAIVERKAFNCALKHNYEEASSSFNTLLQMMIKILVVGLCRKKQSISIYKIQLVLISLCNLRMKRILVF